MKKLRNRFERFCFRNRDKGIPNLMLYVCLGTGLVFLMSYISQSIVLYQYLSFDRAAILRGEVWRLISFPLVYSAGNPVLTLVSLLCYYSLGRSIENSWGTCRFNLFYLTGILLMDAFSLIFGGYADALYLNMSLFLAYATLYPNAQFLLFFIIPIRAWILAVLDLALMVYDVLNMTFAGLFPYSLFPFVALLNYFLFFGKDFVNVFPTSWQIRAGRLFRRKGRSPDRPKVIPFSPSAPYAAPSVKAPYTHRCTVCGRTDVSNPELEFRYCSRCSGYRCYCQDHINSHAHIQ